MDAVENSLTQLLAGQGEIRRVRLRNFRVQASIGIHDFEKRQRQAVIINIDLYLRPHGDTDDDIAKVLDYDFIRGQVVALVSARHYNLQETLAEAIMKICLAPPSVLAARVATEKPDVYPDCDGIGFELTRLRPVP